MKLEMNVPDGTYFINGSRLDPASTERGYWVAETDQKLDPTATPDQIFDMAKALEDLYDVAYVGVWTHEDGRRVLDATHHVKDLIQAIALGRHWDQKAIWDVKRNQAIYLD